MEQDSRLLTQRPKRWTRSRGMIGALGSGVMSLVAAVLGLLVAFGVDLDLLQQQAVIGVAGAVVGLVGLMCSALGWIGRRDATSRIMTIEDEIAAELRRQQRKMDSGRIPRAAAAIAAIMAMQIGLAGSAGCGTTVVYSADTRFETEKWGPVRATVHVDTGGTYSVAVELASAEQVPAFARLMSSFLGVASIGTAQSVELVLPDGTGASMQVGLDPPRVAVSVSNPKWAMAITRALDATGVQLDIDAGLDEPFPAPPDPTTPTTTEAVDTDRASRMSWAPTVWRLDWESRRWLPLGIAHAAT